MSTSINPGSVNDDSESLLRKQLNPALKGSGWDALIASLATGDQTNANNTASTFNQLYTISASGIYLDRVTSNDGITRPKNVGMSDDVYRQLAIKLKNNKLTYESILEILAVYYGEDAVRANATTDGYEPYALADGDDLNVTIDGLYKVKVVFRTNNFQTISAAKAIEVAGAITQAFLMANVKAFAKAYLDPNDNLTKVKIYTGSLGLKGSVEIKGSGGGKSQNALRFDSNLLTGLQAQVYTGPIPSSGGDHLFTPFAHAFPLQPI